ncbi:unnamed protein product, partial [Polarella glacialis]
EGIDAAVAIDDATKMESGGLAALNKLRIGCIRCAGQEELFQQDVSHAHEVFIFLLSFAKQHPDAVGGVAEVVNELMASPCWSSVFECAMPLKERLQELPEAVQAALGLQHAKVMSLIVPAAQKRATGGDMPESIKQVADRMKSIRITTMIAAPPPPPPPPPMDQWKEAKTPEGHSYYFNLRTRESAWERPAALGGPRVYSVGDEVEVWSNGMRAWGRGKVEKVEGSKVTAEFTLPGGGLAKKELPAQHKDLRPVAVDSTSQGWSSEEKAQYQQWFLAIKGGSPDAVPAIAVAHFLGKSGLRRQALKQVWSVANPGSKASLGFEEFARCCRLVAHVQAMGARPGDASLVEEADRPLRVKLRTECLAARPPFLPKFEK